MDNVQFFHYKHAGRTYAVDVAFTRDDLLECIHHFDQPIAFRVGKSFLHPNDNYCKKTGREVSASKMKPVMLYLESVTKSNDTEDDDKLFVEFANKETGEYYTFRLNSKSEKPHFIKVFEV